MSIAELRAIYGNDFKVKAHASIVTDFATYYSGSKTF
jgi:hypothetical protein